MQFTLVLLVRHFYDVLAVGAGDYPFTLATVSTRFDSTLPMLENITFTVKISFWSRCCVLIKRFILRCFF